MSEDKMEPEGLCSALNYFNDPNSELLDDKESLLFLRGLLSLLGETAYDKLCDVEDKLAEHGIFDYSDPYTESSFRLHEIGIFEYKKHFTEQGFRDLQIVLELSKIAKEHNLACKWDFDTFLGALKMITDIVAIRKSDDENKDDEQRKLLKKFEFLYKRITDENQT